MSRSTAMMMMMMMMILIQAMHGIPYEPSLKRLPYIVPYVAFSSRSKRFSQQLSKHPWLSNSQHVCLSTEGSEKSSRLHV